MNYFVHESAICESKTIGNKTRIWAFAHVLPFAKIGENCNICDHVFIENDVAIGNSVTIKCGVQIWDGITIEDNVFIGPNATFTNDVFPRSKQYPETFAKTIIRQGASIGANATILPNITIGQHAMVGAGAVVTHDVPPHAKVIGNPAKIIGYTSSSATTHREKREEQLLDDYVGIQTTAVKGVNLHTFNLIKDLRGNLSAGEFERDLPFQPKRYFLVFDVPSGKVRGEHAHKECQQFLICVKGSCSVVADDGTNRQEVLINRPNIGLHLPPMIWGVQYNYSPDAVLLVFASHYYDPEDYIRNYDEYLAKVEARP